MKFIDKAEIFVRSGDGGDGCLGFRREKYVPRGGPDGGDGGKGGDVIIRASKHLYTLLDFKYKREYEARKGGNGSGSNKHGANSEDVVLEVPVGTVIYDKETQEVIADLVKDQQQVVIVNGGKGGRGNNFFKTSTNQAPYQYELGFPGEEKSLILELKLIADVGLVGCPNAGKSTLISKMSSAKSKIGAYPFTTLFPVLGVVEYNSGQGFVMADIPGLIEGAHDGVGLGDEFLCHIERTKVLLFVIDVSEPYPNNPVEDFVMLSEELEKYNADLLEKEIVVALNKVDVKSKDKIKNMKKKCPYTMIEISALTGEGCDELKKELWGRIKKLK